MDEERLLKIANKVRFHIIEMAYQCGGNAHLGGALSLVEILAVLYGEILHFNSQFPLLLERDRFILSKGHGVLAYYAILAEMGFFPLTLLKTFQQNGTALVAHPVMNLKLGIESSNGSLGQGLSMACGIALYGKLQEKSYKVYVILGNGECNEGAVWEAVMMAAQFKLKNLTVVIDANGMQSDGNSANIVDLTPFAQKFSAFGWNVAEVDGHDMKELYSAFSSQNESECPKVVIAKTIKGKGISFMENSIEWHHNRLTKTLYEQALTELENKANV
ncbi:MAG: transketolase [Synergistaceae bacterium]|nr:transketolase [Synergistaceae bacterium]